jgi:hypothetical protein
MILMASAIATRAAMAGPPVLLGALADQDGLAVNLSTPTQSINDVENLEAQLPNPLAIDSEYAPWTGGGSWSTTNPPQQMIWDGQTDHVTQLTWKPNIIGGNPNYVLWSDIVAGVWDVNLIDKATAIAATNHRVIIRLWPNMDQSLYANTLGVDPTVDPVTAGQHFIAAWKHIVSVMRPVAPNIEWNWSPNEHAFTNNQGDQSTNWQNFYPGDSYVDWVGSQFYNYSLTRVGFPDVLFSAFYAQARTLNKQIIFSETGAIGPNPQINNGYGCSGSIPTNISPEDKWLSTMEAHLPNFPLVGAVVYFSAADCSGGNFVLRDGVGYPDGLTQFGIMLQDPYFGGGGLVRRKR